MRGERWEVRVGNIALGQVRLLEISRVRDVAPGSICKPPAGIFQPGNAGILSHVGGLGLHKLFFRNRYS